MVGNEGVIVAAVGARAFPPDVPALPALGLASPSEPRQHLPTDGEALVAWRGLARFEPGDALLDGRTAGPLGDGVAHSLATEALRIPMLPDHCSLNLSNAGRRCPVRGFGANKASPLPCSRQTPVCRRSLLT